MVEMLGVDVMDVFIYETEADGIDRVEMAIYLENDFRWSSDEDQMYRLWFPGHVFHLRS